jgi:hypothetical protein
MPGAVGLAGDANLADAEEGGDAFGLGLQIGHLPTGRDADAELLTGAGEGAAGDAGHAVVAGRQVRMAAGQRPPSAQVRAAALANRTRTQRGPEVVALGKRAGR